MILQFLKIWLAKYNQYIDLYPCRRLLHSIKNSFHSAAIQNCNNLSTKMDEIWKSSKIWIQDIFRCMHPMCSQVQHFPNKILRTHCWNNFQMEENREFFRSLNLNFPLTNGEFPARSMLFTVRFSWLLVSENFQRWENLLNHHFWIDLKLAEPSEFLTKTRTD